MKRYVKGTIYTIIATIVSILIIIGYSMIFPERRWMSAFYFILIFVGWGLGVQRKNEKTGNNKEGAVRQSKFGVRLQNRGILNSKNDALLYKDTLKGLPFVTVISLVVAYLNNVISTAIYLTRIELVPFSDALDFSWSGVFKIDNEIYIDFLLVIVAMVTSIIVFVKKIKEFEKEEREIIK